MRPTYPLLRFGVIATSVAAACQFSHGVDPGDGGPTDVPPPDSSKCAGSSTECIGDMLRTCPAAGSDAIDTECGWGCISGPAARCAQVVPAGGGVMSGDVVPVDELMNITLDNVTLDSDFGNIGTGAMPTLFHNAAEGIDKGIDFQYRGAISMWRFKGLTITGTVTIVGKRPVALVADGPVAINGILDARGGCATFNAGPGGYGGGSAAGANGTAPATTMGGGSGASGTTTGGGGGGHGAHGGSGDAVSGGSPYGVPEISTLFGGAGGGAGEGGGNFGRGGGGGGAIQIVSNTRIVVSSEGVNVGGCGGKAGTGNNDSGGGGGAGGAILLEAPIVTIGGVLAANGGGGGGGGGPAATPGAAGTLDRMPAPGGTGQTGEQDQDGGAGGVGGTAAGRGSNGTSPGGGGGAIGRIRINTRTNTGANLTSATLSPGPGDPENAFSTGSAATQ